MEEELLNYFQKIIDYNALKERNHLEEEIVEKVNQMLMDRTTQILSKQLNYMEIMSQKLFFMSELFFMQKEESFKYSHLIEQLFPLVKIVNEQIKTRIIHYTRVQEKLSLLNEDIKVIKSNNHRGKDKKTSNNNGSRTSKETQEEDENILLLNLLESKKTKLVLTFNKTRNALEILNNYLKQLTREYFKNKEKIMDIEVINII
nr:uncharacterized protein LOC121125591 [Lepeophtheirus salmonis]